MAGYVDATLLVKKLGAVFLLLLGILLIAVGVSEESRPIMVLGLLALLSGALLLVLKIIRRNQGKQL